MGDGQGFGLVQVGLGVHLDPAHQRVGQGALHAMGVEVQDRLSSPDPQVPVALLDANMAGAVRIDGHVLDLEVFGPAQAELLQALNRCGLGSVLRGLEQHPGQGEGQAQVLRSMARHGAPRHQKAGTGVHSWNALILV